MHAIWGQSAVGYCFASKKDEIEACGLCTPYRRAVISVQGVKGLCREKAPEPKSCEVSVSNNFRVAYHVHNSACIGSRVL